MMVSIISTILCAGAGTVLGLVGAKCLLAFMEREQHKKGLWQPETVPYMRTHKPFGQPVLTVHSPQRWTRVTDRLPKKDGWYLVFYARRYAGVREFKNGQFQSAYVISHWQDLPENPDSL